MSELPVWARKPKHKKELVATDRGWEVKETGELLRSTKFLKSKLEALVDETKEVIEFTTPSEGQKGSEVTSLPEAPVKDEPKQEVEATESKAEEPQEGAQEPQKKKPGPKPGRKRGPKPKSKTE